MKRLFLQPHLKLLFLALLVSIAIPNFVHAWTISGLGFDVIGTVISPIAIAVLKLTSWLTMLSGLLLNAVLKYTVVDMSAHYTGLLAINDAWSLIRDLANMFFIFVLLYAAIKTIIGQGKDTQKLVVNMVIAAVLINFSLFFTKVAIDLSNLITLTFYNAIAPGAATGTIMTAGLSNSLMQPLNLPSIWKMGGGSIGNFSLIGFLGSGVNLVASFVFLSVSVMFIIRYVVLIIVLIMSPVAIISGVLPGLNGTAKKWWDALSGQLTFAPVYMLLTWVTIRIFIGLDPISATWSDVFTGTVVPGPDGHNMATFDPHAIDLVIRFGIVIAFILASLAIAKSIANKSGSGIPKLTSMLTGYAGGALFGGIIGGAGRKLIGGAGAKIADNKELQAKAKDGNAGARLALYASRKARSATFDVRNATIPTATLGDAIKGTAGRTGIGKTLGLDDLNWKSIPVAGAVAGQAGIGQGNKNGYAENQAEKKKRIEEETKASAEELRKAQIKADIEAGLAQGATPAQQSAMLKRIKEMSEKELQSQKTDTLATPLVAETLTGKQLESIEKSDRTEAEKQKIKDAHFATLTTAVQNIASAGGTTTNADRNKIQSFTEKEIDMVDSDLFAVDAPIQDTRDRARAFVKNLSQGQIDHILNKSGILSASQKEKVRATYFEEVGNALGVLAAAPGVGTATGPQADTARKEITSLSDKEIELAPEEMFEINSADPQTKRRAKEVVRALSQSQADQILKTGKLSNALKNEIRAERKKIMVDIHADAIANNNFNALRTEMLKRKKNLAKEDLPILTQNEILDVYTPGFLTQMSTSDDMDAGKATAIRNAIMEAAPAAHLSAYLNATTPVDRRAVITQIATARDKQLVTTAGWLESEAGQIF